MNPALAITPDGLIDRFRADQLNVYVYKTHQHMGVATAHAVGAELRRLIAARGRAIGIFAAALSQKEVLAELVAAGSVEWTRVLGFHLGEYLGVDEDASPSCRKFLLEHLVKRVPMAEFHGLRGEAANPDAVAANYAALLKSRPPDFATLDIGENGRLGFITPSGCDFQDEAAVRVLELNEVYRQEQRRDGLIGEIPRRALALTIPAIMACPRLVATAPGTEAVRAIFTAEITPACPAAILRTHADAHLFLDQEAALARRVI